MAETPVLEAVARAGVGKGAARSARRDGCVPGVIYGGGDAPQPINVRFNTLLKQLKAGRFLSTMINLKVDGKDNKVICRGVQRDVVKDLPTHVDFLRLTDRTRIALHIPIEYVNREKSPGLRRGGVLSSIKGALEARTVGVLRNGYDLNNNRQGGIIQAQGLTLSALAGLDNNGGRISAQATDASITTAAFDNRNGVLYAKGLAA